MEAIIFLAAGIFLLLGIIGSILPVLPGPPLSFLALLLLHFFSSFHFNPHVLISIGCVVIFITFFDYWLQIYGVKNFGGGKKATNGTIIGLIIGIFIFPPIGIIVGPFIGAFIGAKMEHNINEPIKVAFGALLGFLGGAILKVITSIYITYWVINHIIS